MDNLYRITQKKIECYCEMKGIDKLYRRLLSALDGDAKTLSVIVVEVEVLLQEIRKNINALDKEEVAEMAIVRGE